jgi:hypothetical protein
MTWRERIFRELKQRIEELKQQRRESDLWEAAEAVFLKGDTLYSRLLKARRKE